MATQPKSLQTRLREIEAHVSTIVKRVEIARNKFYEVYERFSAVRKHWEDFPDAYEKATLSYEVMEDEVDLLLSEIEAIKEILPR